MSEDKTATTYSSLHIGFLAKDFLNWSGGVWFSQNLLRGLAAMPPQAIRLTIFAPLENTPSIMLRNLARYLRAAIAHPSRLVSVLRSPSPEHLLWKRGIAELTAIVPRIVFYDGSERDLLSRCRYENVDVLMPVMTPLTCNSIPWVGYLYDCQHKHYPEFFRAADLSNRDRDFENMLRRASFVFSNAKAVVSDLHTFFPHGRSKIFALPFTPQLSDLELIQAAEDLEKARRQASGSKYFIVCNQFWVHKDHATAFRAFARFVSGARRTDYRLVCTGLTDDYRMPGHFDRMMALVAELGISDRVIFTGYIDRAQQLALLYGATALLQPTLFEGGPGGGAASDAIALGVPCILSDIPVNQELSNTLATFFKVGDAESLANEMVRVVKAPPLRPTIVTLLEASHKHALVLGEYLFRLATSARTAWIGTQSEIHKMPNRGRR